MIKYQRESVLGLEEETVEFGGTELQGRLFELLQARGWWVSYAADDECISLSSPSVKGREEFVGYSVTVDFTRKGGVIPSAAAEVIDISSQDVAEFHANLLSMRLDMAFLEGAMAALGLPPVKWDAVLY